MPTRKFNTPKIRINRVSTRTGDEGRTRLASGERVFKNSLRIHACGELDELNACLGWTVSSLKSLLPQHPALDKLHPKLIRVQQELFNLGSMLAFKSAEFPAGFPRLTSAEIVRLEEEIKLMNSLLPALYSFVLPGGSRLNAELHMCRTVCRRAERSCVALTRREKISGEILPYLNRLGDALFVWSRWVCLQMGDPEVFWDPNQSASGEENG